MRTQSNEQPSASKFIYFSEIRTISGFGDKNKVNLHVSSNQSLYFVNVLPVLTCEVNEPPDC